MSPGRRALLAVAALAAGCVQSHYNLATRHQDYTFTSTEKEVALGLRLARRIDKELPPLADEAAQQRVKDLGARLAAVSDRRELVYRFTAVEGEQVNAFALPGGFIYVFQGLLEKTSDSELAAVLAHEVAHVAARHAVKRYEAGLGAQLAQLAGLAAGRSDAARGVGIALRAAQLAYSRQDELEADRLGVRYLQAAGIDPHGMLEMLEKIQAEDQKRLSVLPRGIVRPHYALSHPHVPDRVRAVKEALFGVADYVDYLNTSP
jgi:predicted Zn-dependent protease